MTDMVEAFSDGIAVSQAAGGAAPYATSTSPSSDFRRRGSRFSRGWRERNLLARRSVAEAEGAVDLGVEAPEGIDVRDAVVEDGVVAERGVAVGESDGEVGLDAGEDGEGVAHEDL